LLPEIQCRCGISRGLANGFDRHGRIDAVLIHQIDAVGAQTLERSFDRALDVRGTYTIPSNP
jgi:hypothetical protein